MWVALMFNGMWAVVLITASYILIRKGYGAMGLAVANLIAYLLHSMWQMVYVVNNSDVKG